MKKLKRKLQLIPLILIGCIFFFSFSLKAQYRDNVWCFGDSAGLDFSSGYPEAINTSTFSFEPSASICDDNGSLKLYAGHLNGITTVFSYDHTVMENGDSIAGSLSSTNGLLIIPVGEDQFYVFSHDQFTLFYSFVDLTLNQGKGSVFYKNVQLYPDTIVEKIVAVRHGNGRDWWIITHEANVNFIQNDQTQKFIKYLATPEGVFGPYYQEIGTVFFEEGSGFLGEMVISDDGDMLVLVGVNYLNSSTFEARSIIDVFNFDRCTGQLSDWIELGDDQHWNAVQYGCSFSPSGNKLYVSTHDKLTQFKLDTQDVKASNKIIWTVDDIDYKIGQHQLGPDGKIYLTIYHPDPQGDTLNHFVSFIKYPDSAGTACEFNPFSVSLGNGQTMWGLPNNPNYELGPLIGSPCDTIRKEETEIPLPSVIFPNVFSPNGDGTNDTWYPYTTGISSMEYTIFSRWGTVVYTESSSSGREDGLLLQGWNGHSMNGEESTEGVYYFIANWKDRDGVEGNKKGMIQLLR